jgi:uncharacterized protein DUF6680
MEMKDWLTLVALFLGPTSAVIITLWYQKRSEKRSTQGRLFAILMGHRQSNPPPTEWVTGLNLIDVVFEDHRAVVNKWHELYQTLNHPPEQINMRQVGHLRIELLSEMAVALGYHRLSQTDIDRFYAPQVFATQGALSQELQTELLRVLKATQSVHGTPLVEHKRGES